MSEPQHERRPPESGQDGAGAVPGLAKLAASAWWHTTEWGVGASLRGSRRLAQAAVSPTSAAELVRELDSAARRYARALADLGDVEQRVRNSPAARSGVGRTVASVVPWPSAPEPDDAEAADAERQASNGAIARDALRDRGEALLRKSRDVRFEQDSHPAYERILSELAPDEGRILLLMLTHGPQPAVDIRTGGPIGLIRSRLIAPGLSMIGARAGCRYTDRVPSYLHNLFRLGLIWFSRETIQDPLRYQVLEAQPDVLAAIHSVRQTKVVRRSIHLTPFGEDFCRACLPLESEALVGLPEHGAPDKATKVTQPPAL